MARPAMVAVQEAMGRRTCTGRGDQAGEGRQHEQPESPPWSRVLQPPDHQKKSCPGRN